MADAFDGFTEELDRSDEIDEQEINAPRSASEQEDYAPNDSDLLATLKRLFPTFDDKDIQNISQIIMLGRVFPDNFSTKVASIVFALAKKHRHDKDFDVTFTIHIVEGLCQIGLEGKGRVEAVIVSGNTKEQAEQESRVGTF